MPPTRLLVLIAFATALHAADPRGDHADSPPSTPQEQLARFRVPPGFEVQFVAAEPEIQKPINLNFDAAGRLWVSGSEMYPWPASTDPNGRPIEGFDQGWKGIVDGFRVGDAPQPSDNARDTVRILSDFDETGHARKITVFADKLNIPSGIQPLPAGSPAITTVYGLPSRFDPNPDMAKRGPIAERHLGRTPKGDTAIVYSIPNIWMLADWDGDGFAESRVPLYTGFGYTDTHGGSSSYLYWIDGWIYGTHGFRNHSEVRDRRGEVTVLDSGNTFRFRPDGTAFEIYAHGQTNPFGLAFDPLGNLFSADSHSKPVYLLLRGGFYEGIGKQHDGLGFAPRITEDDHGSSSIAGIVSVADDRWPEEYRGNLFNGNPVTQRINRARLDWHGSTPRATRLEDFVTCDDPWFRPVNLKLGPDGALYIADFYNPIIGHYEVPLTHPSRDHTHGRIWRVVWRGEKKDAPIANPPDLSRLTAASLIEKLGDPSLEVRRLATHELVDRIGAPNALTALTVRYRKDSTATAPHPELALWAFERLRAKENVERFATSEDDSLATAALKVLADRETPTSEQVKAIFVAVSSGRKPIARAASEALSQQPSPGNLDPLLQGLQAAPADDTELTYALRMALRDNLLAAGGYTAAKPIAARLPEAAERIADVSLGANSADAAGFLIEHLQRTRFETPRAGDYLKHAILHLPEDRLDAIVALLELAKGVPLPQKLALATNLTEAVPQRGNAAPAALTDWSQAVLLEALASRDDALAKPAIAAMRDLRLPAKLAPLTAIFRDEKRNGWLRLWALEATANLPESREFLASVFADQRQTIFHKRAAELLVQSGDTATALEALSREPWETTLAIAAALAKSDAGATALLDAIDAGKAPARVLVNKTVVAGFFARPKPIQDRARALAKDLPPEDARLDQLIAERARLYRAATASAGNGAAVFQKNCAVCHRFRNASQANVGPNLDGVAARGPERLFEDILDPNRNVDPGFRQTIVETSTGQTLVGTNLRENGDALLLTDATAKELSIPKNTIKSRTTLNLSLMPPVFETQLSPGELNDLVAYLLSPP